MPHLSKLTILLLALTLAACDAADPDDGRIVAGVDFDQLFATPTQAERTVVLQDWAGRDVSVQGYEEVARHTDSVQDVPMTVRIVSHTVGGVRHYGGIIAPEEAEDESLPVLVYLHGGDQGVGLDTEVLFALNLLPEAGRFVVVVPSFRAEPLRFGGQTYTSQGPPSPWDRDVDDALALVNVALEAIPAADPDRIAALGFSRGAAVAMLMAVRDPRIGTVVEFFGPTDFLGTFVQDVTAEALQGRPRNLPGLNYLDATFIQPLKRGEVDVPAVRLELIRRSVVHFAEHLPRLQIHHGTADSVVPVSEAEALDKALRRLGRTEPEYQYYVYQGGEHSPFSLSGSFDRAISFLSPVLAPGVAAYDPRYAAHRTPFPAFRHP